MEVLVDFKQVNPEYNSDLERADIYKKLSSDTKRFNFKEGFKVDGNVKQIHFNRDGVLNLEGKTSQKIKVNDVTILNCITDDDREVNFIISNKLIAQTRKDYKEIYDKASYTFYLKRNSNYISPAEGVFISKDDLPFDIDLN